MEQNFSDVIIENSKEKPSVDTSENARELSDYYERQSRRYNKRIDCEKEVQ